MQKSPRPERAREFPGARPRSRRSSRFITEQAKIAQVARKHKIASNPPCGKRRSCGAVDTELKTVKPEDVGIECVCVQGWCWCAIYAILKQKPHNFTTNMLKSYLGTQSSSLSAFMISKTYISAQKPHGRQLNVRQRKCHFLILSFFVQNTCNSTQ